MANLPYLGLVIVLTLSGFGLPLPEDIPLIIAGYLCSIGKADIGIMLPVAFCAVVGTDLLVFALGRRFGHRIPRLPVIRRFLKPERMAKAHAAFHKHGIWVLFLARFLPGIRTPVYFSAGHFGIPVWKMVACDGSAALISVPTIVLLAYHLAHERERVIAIISRGESVIFIVVILAIAAVIAWRYWLRPGRPAADQPLDGKPQM